MIVEHQIKVQKLAMLSVKPYHQDKNEGGIRRVALKQNKRYEKLYEL